MRDVLFARRQEAQRFSFVGVGAQQLCERARSKMAEVILGHNVTEEQRRVVAGRRNADAARCLQLDDCAGNELLEKRAKRFGLGR